MIDGVLKFIFCMVLLDYISTNSLNVNKNGVAAFTTGYQYYQNIGYYKHYRTPSTWGQAWKQCREDGAHLVVIDSDEEHAVVWNMVQQSDADAFIGVHDLFLEGFFFTVTGKPLVPSSFNKWSNGEPNNYGDQDCLLLEISGQIWDGKCDKRYNFICEFELNQFNTVPM